MECELGADVECLDAARWIGKAAVRGVVDKILFSSHGDMRRRGLGFRVWGLEFRVKGLGFSVKGLWFRV